MDMLQRAMQMRPRFDTHGDVVGSRLGEGVEIGVAGCDHQVHVKKAGVTLNPAPISTIEPVIDMRSNFRRPPISIGRPPASARNPDSFSTAAGMNFWPPKPGLTDMTRIRSTMAIRNAAAMARGEAA